MANQYVNKVIYGGETLIDISSDTVTAAKILTGYTAHDKSGAPITGNCTYDAYTSDANAVASEILNTKTAYVSGSKVTGEMPNRGNNNITVTSKSGTTIPNGYYDGSGKAVIDSTSATNLVATNIRSGVTILGVEGTLSSEDSLTVGSVSATPYTTAQTITAASQSYDYITQVTIAAIAYAETDNSAGGKTVTIGTVAPTT